MKHLKSLFLSVFAFIIVLSCTSCRLIYVGDEFEEEKRMYNEAICALFDALDTKDEDAIYQMFTPDVRENHNDLKEKIFDLTALYSAKTGEIGWDNLPISHTYYEKGKKQKDLSDTFPVRSGDHYYWVHLDVICENTIIPEKVGITHLKFYTMDEYYISCSENLDTVVDSNKTGLDIYAERMFDGELRVIDGHVFEFTQPKTSLTVKEAEDFLEQNLSFSSFQERFGNPNAAWQALLWYYYELPDESEALRYIKLRIDDEGNIYAAEIINDFGQKTSIYPFKAVPSDTKN